MPRNKIRKTDKGLFSAETMKSAVEEVTLNNKSIRNTAEIFGISRTTLSRYVEAAKNCEDPSKVVFKKSFVTTQVFTVNEEKMLTDYIIQCSKMFHGLSVKATRKLAWEYAKKLQKTYPNSWDENSEAGREWFFGLMKRNKDLSLRMPESTSLARACAFNEHNVKLFFDQYEDVITRPGFDFQPHRIWNLDETGIRTVQDATKVLSQKGLKQVGQICSSERGVLITMCCCINAAGTAVPPAYVFPRVHFKDFMLNGAPPGSLGLAAQSGWMNCGLFQETLEHFIHHMNVSKDNPAVLLMDNHESHVTLEVIDKAREHGLTILSFPPHCSHRLQPLDVSVYGPFKKFYNSTCSDWMISNPGKHITIYDVAGLSKQAYYKAFTPGNITQGFNKTGLFPFNRNIFTDDMFLPSTIRHSSTSSVESNQSASTSEANKTSEDQQPLSPEVIRPYPKSNVEKGKRAKRTAMKSTILTDTPEREKRCKLQADKLSKRSKPPAKRKLIDDNIESSSESDTSMSLAASSDDDVFTDDEDKFQNKEPDTEDFIIARYEIGNNIRHYVGVITAVKDNSYVVKYFRKSVKHTLSCAFVEPAVEDTDTIARSNIVAILPKPINMNTTKRRQGIIRFTVPLDEYNIL